MMLSLWKIDLKYHKICITIVDFINKLDLGLFLHVLNVHPYFRFREMRRRMKQRMDELKVRL